MTSQFVIIGGRPLHGTVHASGSKNAALPILAATLLVSGKVTLKNVPDLSDIRTLIDILELLGASIHFEKNVLHIDTKNVKNKTIPHEKVSHLRGSIILLGALLSRFQKASMAFPGGCVIGKRPIQSHLHVFETLGAKIQDKETIGISAPKGLKNATIIMNEASVTATENAILASVFIPGTTIIKCAAAEPHVSDLCDFLNMMGAKISGIGTHTLEITGVKKLKEKGTFSITSDYLEVGTFAIAAAITKGHVTIKGAVPHHLDSFWQKMKEAGVQLKYSPNEVEILPSKKLSATSIRTAIFPSFPTDLQAPFGVLMTQAKGVSRIFETMFEGRLNYIFELEKMGATVEFLNKHQALIIGPTKLQGTPIASLDIRAGAAMVLAALCAKGRTEISNINYIDRGYDALEEKLTSLGANIKRVSKKER